MRTAYLVGAGVAAALVGALLARQAVAVQDNAQAEDAPSSNSSDPGGYLDAFDQSNPFAQMESATMATTMQDPNVQAFLTMISVSEGTAREADPYAVCYGYAHTVQDFSDHPAITGEWRGESLAKLGPSYAGKVSTAAGRYQIIKPTWQGCKRALGLLDFSPQAQDLAAVYLVREAGALDLVQAGQFDQAVQRCARQWASLPGANAPGQAMRRLSDLRAAYEQAGGSFA